MRLDLTRLFDNVGEQEDFSGTLDLSSVKRWGSVIFPAPVKVQGIAQNRSGIVSVRYTVDFMLDAPCDRCLTAVKRQMHQEFAHTVVLSLNREDNDELIVVPDGKLDLAELASSDILLELPTSIVCDDDCKGLCPNCGKNLNEGKCGCVPQTGDPRLASLRALLQEED